jgi:hypothetical protein
MSGEDRLWRRHSYSYYIDGMSRRIAWALLVISFASGCAWIEDQEFTDVDGPVAEVRRMLDERAEALAAGDVEEYLTPVSGAVKLPLAGINVSLREADLAPSGDVIKRARVDFAYWFEELPEDNLFHLHLLYDFERRDGAWHVTASRPEPVDTGHEERQEPPPLPIWATGPFEVNRSRHFLVLSRPDVRDLKRIAALAEKGRAELIGKLLIEADPKHLIVVAGGGDEFLSFVGGNVPERSVAVAQFASSQVAAHNLRPENRQLVVNLAALFGGEGGPADEEHAYLADALPTEVFRHELGHLALSRVTTQYTPGWVFEGGAMELAEERRTDDWRAGLASGAFDEMSFVGLSRESNLENAAEYAYANAAVSYLVDEHGRKKFFEFYRSFREFEVEEQKSLKVIRGERTRRLLKLVYSLDEDELDARTIAWMRREAG